MDTRTSLHRNRTGLALMLVLGIAGCDSVYTIHSIASLSDEPPSVPDVSGLWAPSGATWVDGVMRSTAVEYDIGQCRDVTISVLGATSVADETVGDEICFVPISGYLIAQIRTTGQVQLYQQYLFKFDEKTISFCDKVWTELLQWSDDHPHATAGGGLEFGRRGGDTTELFITSPRDAVREYLVPRLPEILKACDEVDEEGDSGWITYVRLMPPRRPDAAGAADASASPQD